MIMHTLNVRTFPDSSPVTAESKPLFDEAYRNSPPSAADLAFSSIFGWQEYFSYRVSRWGDFLIVFYVKDKQMCVLPPLLFTGRITDPGFGDRFHECALEIRRYCDTQGYGLVFVAFPDLYARRLPAGKFAVTPDRNSDDYIYRRQDLAKLQGSAYSSKRNFIRQFTKNYPSHRFELLTPANASLAHQFFKKWQHTQTSNDLLGMAAYCMACRLLDHFPLLNLYGILLYAGNEIVAASLGSIVPDFMYEDGAHPTVIVHHENALTEYKGVYQMVNQIFCLHLPKEVEYVNREDDLGLAGLRKAKLSYHPLMLLKKNKIIIQ